MARAAPSSETRRPSSMARCDGNNCLYNIRHGSTEESARWAAPRRALPGQCRGDKRGQKCSGSCQTPGQHGRQLPGTVSRASLGRAVLRGRPPAVLPAPPEPRTSMGGRMPQPRQPYGTQHHGQRRTAATPLGQGDAAASTAPVWPCSHGAPQLNGDHPVGTTAQCRLPARAGFSELDSTARNGV